MKINAKLLIITFSIISFVSVTSAFIYHTLAKQLLQTQQSKSLVNSVNDFIFTFQNYIESIDDDYINSTNTNNFDINNSKLDFVFAINQDSTIVQSTIVKKKKLNIYSNVQTLKEFINFNSNLILRQAKLNGNNIFYGFKITNNITNKFSETIRAEIAVVEENVVSQFTNDKDNELYLPYLSKVARHLKDKNNFELVSETIDGVDFSATHFSPDNSVIAKLGFDFIIYSTSKESQTFKDTMNIVTLIIVVSGILLTIIFLFLFTTKFRKQLSYIDKVVKSIVDGNLEKRVKIISKDEIGKLGIAFNDMLDKIKKTDAQEKEYTEFVSLINRNPTLEKIGDVTLRKVIETTNTDVGAMYLCQNEELVPFSVFGMPKVNKVIDESGFYSDIKTNKEIFEISFTENHPIIKTGITELKINYIIIFPIVYNNEVIAIMELASVNKPVRNYKVYYEKIKNQLAIGLANGKAFSELENLVKELKSLNNAYQKQNLQITEQNEQLIKLHEQLKINSNELEIQSAKAVESVKFKSQFLANMSHELRTPQNSILGLTELILKDKTTPNHTKKRLNVVLRNGKKLLNLIENILEYSKLDSGKNEVVNTTVSLNNFVNEIKSFIEPIFLERNIELIVEVNDTADFNISIDVKKVEQIVFNLIGNAAKFTEEGYVKLSFSIKNSDFIINVEDTGSGISENDQQIIFEEFRQVDANLNRSFSGTGLGLAICKRYTDLLGGKIELISLVGKGSIFNVQIPVSIISKKSEKSIPLSSKKSLDNYTAFIISDGDNSVKLISDYLKSNDISVTKQNSKYFNKKIILKAKPSIIIIDINLIYSSGIKLLETLKSDESINHIPIVIINMDEEANCGLGLNIFDYYAKKLNKKNVIQVISDLEKTTSIKLQKLMFLLEDEKFKSINSELVNNNLNIYHSNGNNDIISEVKKNEPDLIIIDLLDEKINNLALLAELNEDSYSKNIPIISFISSIDNNKLELFNNSIIESTLLNQYNPLEVLKTIGNRIELIGKSFETESLYKKNNSLLSTKKVQSNKNYKASILIVDDDKDARFTIGEILKSLGYNTLYAVDGYDCLSLLEKETPDLVLLDIMMPKLDGFQTIRRIRENEKLANLTVYALTAYAMLSDKEIIEKNSFNGLITKPVNTIQLERNLNNIFTTAEHE